MKKLTIEEAYQAMFAYLESLYDITQSDDIGSILGSMALLDDGQPADAAVWDDWLEAVAKVSKEE